MKVLILLSSFYSSTGDAVNERQLTFALSRKVEKCYAIIFPSIRGVLSTGHRKALHTLPKNMMAIDIPVPHRFFITTFVKIVASYILSIVVLLSGLHKKINLIYIRDSALATGFLTFKSLADRTIVKIAAIYEDEILNRGVTAFLVRKIVYMLDKFALAKAKKIAVHSALFYSKLVQRRNFKPDNKCLLLPPGIDMTTIKKVKKLKIKSEKSNIKIGYVGSLYWWQGVDTLTYAINIVKKEIPNVKFIIVGDGPLRPQIEKLCKKLKLNFEITGYLSHEKALEWLSLLDVMVLPRKRISTTETIIPIKVLEAWALGIPIIITKHEVFVESGIKDREHVVYCEPEPSNVANAILLILKNEEIKKRLSKNGPKLAEEFSYDKIADRLLKVVNPANVHTNQLYSRN